jgi:hypothetical protein
MIHKCGKIEGQITKLAWTSSILSLVLSLHDYDLVLHYLIGLEPKRVQGY